LPHLFSTTMYIFILRQIYLGIPSSLAEAAYIDGMNDFGIWFKIYVPLSKPTLAFIMVQVFMGTWNEFMGPLIYISTPSKYTLMLGLRLLSEKYRTEQNIVMAASICAIIPVFIVYIFAQKQFVSGLASGAVKQ
ncbi:MAG: carbohydrate ABC transporter permease, partial [Clostridia bacterium]|nr:carbohydrate ABC transporter permease [Clostridia bacterium]